ncbi:MAG: phage holin family protein [Actinobacteria bacterium]|nr:MAG: phage holin family protein [Actinomycetota bacterium]
MATRATDSHPSLGASAKEVAEHASSLVRLELELATLELKRKVTALGFGIGFGIGAAIFAVFGLGFAFATIAAALATFLSTWLALLIVTLGLFGLAALLGLMALAKIKKGTPPLPEQAIREARLTTDALKANGR